MLTISTLFTIFTQALHDVTNTDISEAAFLRLGDIGTIDSKTYRVKEMQNSNGTIVNDSDATRMDENEFKAIETVGSTGRSLIHEENQCSQNMQALDTTQHEHEHASARHTDD